MRSMVWFLQPSLSKQKTSLLFCASKRPDNAAPMVHCMHNQPSSPPYLLQTEDPGLALKKGPHCLSGIHDLYKIMVKNTIKAVLHNLQSSACQTTYRIGQRRKKEEIDFHTPRSRQKLEPRTPQSYPPSFLFLRTSELVHYQH